MTRFGVSNGVKQKAQTRTEFAFVCGSLGLVCSKDAAGAQSVEAFVFFGQQPPPHPPTLVSSKMNYLCDL